MSTTATRKEGRNTALARLADREEVLQVCYWFQGEGFGDVFNSALLDAFLKGEKEKTDTALEGLADDGYLELVSTSTTGYRFTAKGKREAARVFADGFADWQKRGHGECPTGCCDGDDHSQCGDDCTLR